MKAEPAAIAAVVVALVNAVVLLAFGRELEKEEIAALNGVVIVLAGFWVRSQVTPVKG